ncbi:MAG: DUF2807 domain-containing protein [Bacteroidota bacterium]
MKTSIKILWVGLALMLVTGLIFITLMRMDLREILPEDGNGVVIEKTISMEEFAGFTVHDGLAVHYLPADKYEIKITTDSNLFKFMRHTIFNGDWLHISTTAEFGNPSQIDVTIYAPSIKGLQAYNNSEIICDSAFKQTSLKVKTENSASASFFAITENLELEARNSSNITARGQTEDLNIISNNSSQIDASDLLSQYAEVTANGSGEVEVSVEQRLVSNSRAGGQVVYTGPESLNVKSVGNGTTRPKR